MIKMILSCSKEKWSWINNGEIIGHKYQTKNQFQRNCAHKNYRQNGKGFYTKYMRISFDFGIVKDFFSRIQKKKKNSNDKRKINNNHSKYN